MLGFFPVRPGPANERYDAWGDTAVAGGYDDTFHTNGLRGNWDWVVRPNLLNHFDTEAIVALIPPRAVLFLDGDKDPTSPVDVIHAIEADVRGISDAQRKLAELAEKMDSSQKSIGTIQKVHRAVCMTRPNRKADRLE